MRRLELGYDSSWGIQESREKAGVKVRSEFVLLESGKH